MPAARPTVADLRALKGRRPLTMLYVETPDEAQAAAGAFAAELEAVPDRVVAEIAKRSSLILLGMGAGAGGDAQYLFAEDVLGCTRGHRPRHAKSYRNFAAEYARFQEERRAASAEFRADVIAGSYPAPGHGAPIADAEFDSFLAQLDR